MEGRTERGKKGKRKGERNGGRKKGRKEGKNVVMREKLEGIEGRSRVRGPQKLTAQFGDEQGWTPSFGLSWCLLSLS